MGALHKFDEYGILRAMGTVEEILATADGGQGLLDSDDVPNANQSLSCFSCSAELVGLYCHECGNKNDDFRRSIFSLIAEMFLNITAIDSRIWRSSWSLLRRPGQMAREFADGARTRWTSPIRMFLTTSLLLFGYIAVTGTQMIALGELETLDDGRPGVLRFGEANEGYDQRLHFFVEKSRLATPTDIDASAQKFFTEVTGTANNPEAQDELRQAITDMDARIENASSDIERRALTATRDGMQAGLDQAVANVDGATTDADEVGGSGNNIRISGPDGTTELDNETLTALYQRVLRHPEIVNNELNTKMKWMMFLMMPMAMILGAIFIRGRDKAMLYDHLVHAAYVHSFSFLLLFVFVVLAQHTPVPFLFFLYTAILLIYLPISAKNAFQRGWFKSILTAYSVGAVYTFIMFIAATVFVAGALKAEADEIVETSKFVSPSAISPTEGVPNPADPD